MIKYVPFLKLKSNEIMALKELSSETKDSFIPFFDYAKREVTTDNGRLRSPVIKEDSYEDKFKSTVDKLFNSLKKNAQFLSSFYLDNYDLPENFMVDGKHNYQYLLSKFSKLPVIPVVGIDRNQAHLKAVVDLRNSGSLSSEVLAFRITKEDFEDYRAIEDEISENLADIFELFNNLDLVIDCRVCTNQNPIELAKNIVKFIKKFTEDYDVRRIIVTGSSLPASIADVAAVSTEEIIDRTEFDIYKNVISRMKTDRNVIFGDYATVSPNYSEPSVPTYAIRSVTAPKIIYTFNESHFIKRGSALATHPLGNGQYELLLKVLVKKKFFRTDNSWGDKYLVEKSNGQGSDATPGTMVKPLCNSHITYVCQQLNDEI